MKRKTKGFASSFFHLASHFEENSFQNKLEDDISERTRALHRPINIDVHWVSYSIRYCYHSVPYASCSEAFFMLVSSCSFFFSCLLGSASGLIEVMMRVATNDACFHANVGRLKAKRGNVEYNFPLIRKQACQSK